ncbi:lipase family alpha/beta hydrolase [Burkholderia vietnamiensis]|uniref:lipase family alpha/beta hydrolase n=1 Tax=Burkholderia vietnamiensis TaxID=60552 RepID=UPI000AB52A79|nr:GPI inositol-deacylase [Burkholderia vietnamiensis]
MGPNNSGSNNAAKQSDTVVIQGQHEPGGGSSAKVTLTPDANKCTKEFHCDPRPPIPVIFIPGVMGSLLINRNTGQEIWNPPNETNRAAIAFGWNGYFSDASERETKYDTSSAVVSTLGAIVTTGCDLTVDEARRRGWGSVHSKSYHGSLAWLERELNHPMKAGKLLGAWASGDPKGEDFTLNPVIGTAPSSYGANGPGIDPLKVDSDEFKKFCQYRYPVYAIGYNWLQSNLLSAEDAVKGVDYVDQKTHKKYHLMGIKEICAENKVKKAIIITHSMGGLVARMASVIAGYDDLMYGVIHGAQPATGAPLAARRFRAGAEGEGAILNKVLVGRNAPEFTAITVNAPGPLELLPMPDYHDYEPWWVVRDMKRQEVLALPKKNDTLKLFTSQAWYGLVPNQSDAMLDPAGIAKQRLQTTQPGMTLQKNFLTTMQDVVDRQHQLINNYHPNTFAFYGNGPLRRSSEVDPTKGGTAKAPTKQETTAPADKLLTFGRIYWRGDFPAGTTEEDLMKAELLSDDQKGQVRIRVKGLVCTLFAEIMDPNFPQERGLIFGDGTVPSWSGESVARGLKAGVPGEKAKGVQIAFTQNGFDHQGCFGHPWAKWATLYSMVKVAKSIDVPV